MAVDAKRDSICESRLAVISRLIRGRYTRQFLRDSFIVWLFYAVTVVNGYLLHDDVCNPLTLFRYALTFNLGIAFSMVTMMVIQPVGKVTDGCRQQEVDDDLAD